ncbi:hypothetical protein K7432_011057, partial [Basidiobolus ranarum]
MLYSLSLWMLLLSSGTFALPNGQGMLNEEPEEMRDSLIRETLTNFLEGSAFSGDFAGRVRAALGLKLTQGLGGGFNGNFMAKGGGNLGTILKGDFDIGGRGKGGFGFGEIYLGGLNIDLPPPAPKPKKKNIGQFGSGKAPQKHSPLPNQKPAKKKKSVEQRIEREPAVEERAEREPAADERVASEPAGEQSGVREPAED